MQRKQLLRAESGHDAKRYFYGLEKPRGLFRISGLNPSTSITQDSGLLWAPFSHIPACHLFVPGQHSVRWAFLAYWHPAAEYSTHNALQQAPVFIAKPCHVISFGTQFVFLLFQRESNRIARVVPVQCAVSIRRDLHHVYIFEGLANSYVIFF